MAKRSEVERPWLRGGEQEAPERAPERERGEAERSGAERKDERVGPDDERGGEPRRKRAGKEVRRAGARGDPRQRRVQRTRTSFSCSSRAGPMPGTASSSSSEPKAPFFAR